MMPFSAWLRSPRAPFVLVFSAGLGLFGGGVAMGALLRLAACPLCIIQRMLYLSLGLAALVGLAVARHPLGRRLAALAMALVAATGAFVAGYQTWIQRFARDVQCAGEAAWWELLVDRAGESLPLLFQASGLCSDPAWKFLGLSIAEWSLAIFAALCAFSLRLLCRRQPRNSL